MKNICFYTAALILSAQSCNACMTPKIDTPEQLVIRADAIYQARADEYVVPFKSGSSPRVIFTVLGTIKGPNIKSIQFPGALSELNDKNDMTAPYTFVRPDGRRGRCYATKYKLGQDYLLFIKGNTPYWSRLAPTNEEVTGNSDPWILWVRKAAKESPRNLTTQSR